MAPVMSAEELRASIKSLGLKRREFAEAIGVSLPTVNSWITGRREVSSYVRPFFDAQRRIRDLENQVAGLRSLMYESERRERHAGVPDALLLGSPA